MSAQSVTPELRRWIIEQAEVGCQADTLLAAMRASGWEESTAIAALDATLREHLGVPADMGVEALAALTPPVEPRRAPVPEPNLAGSPSAVWAHDRRVDVLLQLRHPRVVVFGGFLSHEECDALVADATPRMSRSETVVNATGGNEVNAARTSSGMFFNRGESDLCARIEARIAALVQWPVERGEGLQVLNYQPGAEYKPHHDYFDPAQPGMGRILERGGQRVGTVVMYLNTPEQGGGTTFPDVGLEVAPIKGNAVFFSYDRPHADTRTLHGGAPVVAGEKWVATKWMREGEFR